MEKIRNFSIIAHIDHGKSTLCDRFLEITGGKDPKEKNVERVTDQLELEQEKGITIKLTAARMSYKGYILNLIDTPGHVDFSYEVSRSLKASEGALLLVDISQGIQAQTISNAQKARDLGLKMIPVLTKIDLPNMDIDERKKEFATIMGFSEDEILLVSGKTGAGAEEVLDAIIERIPAPTGDPEEPLRAIIFDSYYHEHKGVVSTVRIFSGTLPSLTTPLHILRHKIDFLPKEIGYFTPDFRPANSLNTGEVGYIATGKKDIKLFTVGDTISDRAGVEPLPDYHRPKPNVFASLFPADPDEYLELSQSLTKLSLNDASLVVTPQRSQILGAGFRCGFLGTLHMEVVQERLEREYGVSLVITAPSVEYHITSTEGKSFPLQTAAEFPDPSTIREIREPWVKVDIFAPQRYIGQIMELCERGRGEYRDTTYFTRGSAITSEYVLITYELPLMSLLTKFFDNLKSISNGYASLDYTLTEYKSADIVRVSIIVNKEEVPPLSFLEIRERADARSRVILKALKDAIPKHQFTIALQAAIGGKIIAREDIGAMRKDVTAKLYGGDVTRKRKLLDKQKKGKRRLKEIGGVNIPQNAFLSVLEE